MALRPEPKPRAPLGSVSGVTGTAAPQLPAGLIRPILAQHTKGSARTRRRVKRLQTGLPRVSLAGVLIALPS